MSRIGRMPIALPEGVSVTIDNTLVTVKGPKGTLSYDIPEVIKVAQEENSLVVTRQNDEKIARQLHGTVRANIANMVEGVSKEFSKVLVMKGTGYKSAVEGKEIVLYVGYSNPVRLPIPEGVNVVCGGNGNTQITVSGINKQKVGQLSAQIRGIRPPEPYLGKGIAYTTEHIRRKEGKKAGKK